MTVMNPRFRWLIAALSLCLTAILFVPIWRIDLFAPQYPEGLVMKIWHNDLKGDIEIINGLNHYIGMRHISVEMFPEFVIIKYVLIGYILLGLGVAYFGYLRGLFWYIVLSIFGGIFTLYDFYRWGYEYGHNLAEDAAIKVPGMSYQPPVIGHKRLLNFDSYSMPDIGAWILIVVVSVFFGIYFYHIWKLKKSAS
jgi:copper chaperone NosL